MKTIPKFLPFVILTAFFVALTGCGDISNGSNANGDIGMSEVYSTPAIAGKITSRDINESSGLAASRCQENVLWTHNDSGDGAFIYAIDTNGKLLGVWRVAGAANIDWEDIAIIKNPDGKCQIYIGEIGNNKLVRERAVIYRVSEPDVSDASDSTKRSPKTTEQAERLVFNYPDGSQNAEALLVHPQNGDIYVISKMLLSAAGVYRIKPDFDKTDIQTAVRIGEVSLPAVPNGLVTAGDISSDGRRVVLSDYFAGYELALPNSDADFDEIWKVMPKRVDIGKRDTGEAVTYSPDGNTIYSTSEKTNAPLYKIMRKLE